MKSQQGYVLITLTFMLFLIASVSLVLNREGSMLVSLGSDEKSVTEARQVALGGLNHLVWRANQQDCSGYTDVASTNFGNHSYSATISPGSGSPVNVTATSVLADGSAASVERLQQTIYQPIKPAISISTADGSSQDTHVSDYYFARGNHGGESELYTSGNFFGSKTYTLLSFDLSSLPSDILVTEANLALNVKSISVQSGVTEISVERMTVPWTENGASYSTSDGSTAWTFPPPMDSTSYSIVAIDSSTTGVHDWDITRLVQQWIDGEVPNYGLALASTPSITSVNFESSDDSTATLIPTLTVRYTCECGDFCDTGVPPPTGLAHWKLDEKSGTSAEDSVGGNDGTTYGPNWTTGQIDGAASFDGSTDYINVPHSNDLSFNEEMSISAWINPSRFLAGTDSYQTIISKGTSDATEEFWFGLWQDQLEFGILDRGNYFYIGSIGAGIQLDNWYHVVVTFSDQTDIVMLYVDGAIVGSGLLTKNLIGGNEDVQIGRSLYGEHWAGLLDDIQLFDYILTPEEVVAITKGGGKEATVSYSVFDQFNALRFDGDDGSMPWSGDWKEVGESDGPTSGDIQVRSYDGRDYTVQLKDNDNGGEGVQREADLSSCKKAKLAYEYQRRGLDRTSDYVLITVSPDGGSSWNKLAVVEGPGSDTYFQPDSYDITPYIATNTVIRFQTSSTMGGNDIVYFDNIEIRMTECD